ncbi:tetratricopeptide repeat protein [Micropruina sonneratiae]|uniref:tetratricopeptide repeat protein n=1 Tax=Micropruina sonneratiae TaxID=2986940 RepID=UPI002227F334|nr:tetratricopeptide repeat protein [Micropruina sp. KQZ13P-5]MCW3157554.1 tetratricopeptide repeat protein [Micropruina sp. KQZ13P-5]
MTLPKFTSRAMDLSGIAAAAKAPPVPPGASFVIDVDEQNFEAVMQLSTRHPVVVELYSPRANAQALSDDLIALANAAGGAYLLARVNVDAAGQIAQALGIQAVPTVIGVVAGQLAPLFQGTRSKAEAESVIGQLLQVAASNGLVGRAEPVAGGAGETDEADPRFAAADAALERGDFAAAVVEYDKILAQTPNDPEAKAGRAQVALLARSTGSDPAAVLAAAQAEPDSVDAQLAAADLEVLTGQPDQAFGRLIALIRTSAGPDRETVRVRLLELFEVVGAAEPAVLKARRDLMSALF